MSIVADRTGRPELPRQWERLERLTEEAALVVAAWRRRALEAEEEIGRLRRSLEDLAEQGAQPVDAREEIIRLRAENAALHSRMQQARARVAALLKRLATLEIEP